MQANADFMEVVLPEKWELGESRERQNQRLQVVSYAKAQRRQRTGFRTPSGLRPRQSPCCSIIAWEGNHPAATVRWVREVRLADRRPARTALLPAAPGSP